MSTSTGLGELGNLAQSARAKELKTARGILIFVGIFYIILHVARFSFAEKLVDNTIELELKNLQRQGMVVDEEKLAEVRQQMLGVNGFIMGLRL